MAQASTSALIYGNEPEPTYEQMVKKAQWCFLATQYILKFSEKSVEFEISAQIPSNGRVSGNKNGNKLRYQTGNPLDSCGMLKTITKRQLNCWEIEKL